MYQDLRGFILAVDALGALRRIDDVDPSHEIGGITEVAAGLAACPALLFDRIKGFPAGTRVFTNAVTNPQRAALALGIDPTLAPCDGLKAWMEKRKILTPRTPVAAANAAWLENSMRGGDVALERRLHRLRQPRCHARSGRRLDQRLDLPRPGPWA